MKIDILLKKLCFDYNKFILNTITKKHFTMKTFTVTILKTAPLPHFHKWC